MKLIYVNGLGPNYKGDNIYEFIFSDTLKVWGEDWGSQPCNGYPQPPGIQYIKKVGILRNTNIELDLIQNSDFFSMIDAMDDVIALAWEKESFDNKKRLVFRFGESLETIKDKLYEIDIILEFEKKFEYETQP
jgi:hypothetical protein